MMNSCIKFFWEDILSHPNTLKSESNFFSDRKNMASFNMTEINENIKGLRKAAEAVLL